MVNFRDIIRGDGWEQTFQVTENPIPIQSSTDASPIVLTLQRVHTFATSDKVNVMNHNNNTGTLENNGNFIATKINTLQISLQGSTGNGAGINTGVVAKCVVGTGYTLICNIKKSESDTETAIAVPTISWIDQTIFRFKLSLTKTQTLALEAGDYVISVRWTDPNGVPFTFIEPEAINVLETPTSV